MKRPSGGMSLTPPAALSTLLDGHRVKYRQIHDPSQLCFPDGPVRVRMMSGTLETLDVKAIVPFAKVG